MSNFSLVFRMRSEALSLLFILALSDGADHNDRYNELKRRHILPLNFDTGSGNYWVNHLVNNNLCDVGSLSSFIAGDKYLRNLQKWPKHFKSISNKSYLCRAQFGIISVPCGLIILIIFQV